MKLRDYFRKLTKRRAARQPATDWTTTWTARDWADLPTWHARRDDDMR